MIILAKYFRSGHAQRSKKMLVEEMENAADQPVPMRLWRLVAEICAGHQKSMANLDEILNLPRKEMGSDNDEFGADIQLERLSKMGDLLEKVNAAIDWEIFRAPIVERIRQEDYSKGGKPPIDEIMMFKMSLLKNLHNISDDSTEYLINDRLSFQRFLGMELGEKAPDAKTLWLFKEKLGEEGMRELFDVFNKKLHELGVVKREGSLIDASFVDVPRQRNTREKTKPSKRAISPKVGKTPKIPTFLNKKTQMPDGQKKAAKPITATKTMQKLIM
jgi:transposase